MMPPGSFGFGPGDISGSKKFMPPDCGQRCPCPGIADYRSPAAWVSGSRDLPPTDYAPVGRLPLQETFDKIFSGSGFWPPLFRIKNYLFGAEYANRYGRAD